MTALERARVATTGAVVELDVASSDAVVCDEGLALDLQRFLQTVDAVLETVEDERCVGAEVVADLEDELRMLSLLQGLEARDLGFSVVAIAFRQSQSVVARDQGRRHFHAGFSERFDEHGARVVFGFGDAKCSHQGRLSRERRDGVARNLPADLGLTINLADAVHEFWIEFHGERLASAHRL